MGFGGLARVAALWAVVGLVPGEARAFRKAVLGAPVPNLTLATLGGGKAPLLGKAPANLFVYVRSGQQQSVRALEIVTRLQREQGAALRAVAVVSSRDDRAAVRELLAAAGASLPVLVDDGDRLAGELELFSVPVAAIADARGRLVACDFFTTLFWGDALEAGIAAAATGAAVRTASSDAAPGQGSGGAP